MTQKELLYVEDAIGHENNMISICNETSCMLEDDKLVSFMNDEIKKHTKTKEMLMKLLEDKEDE